MTGYTIVRNWVDERVSDWGIRSRGALFPGMLPLMLLAWDRSLVTLAVATILAGGWFAFVGWRFWVVLRAESRVADRDYDHRGKYRLAREYHQTESATATTERKRRR